MGGGAAGGLGGGGAAGQCLLSSVASNIGNAGVNGTANTGGGGGGGAVQSGRSTNARGGNGGSGFVIISYTYLTSTTPIITVTNSNALTYRVATTLKSSGPVDGPVSFFWKGKRIPGCSKISAVAIGSNFEASCNWSPSGHGATAITASVIAKDTSGGNVSGSAQFFVLKRQSQR